MAYINDCFVPNHGSIYLTFTAQADSSHIFAVLIEDNIKYHAITVHWSYTIEDIKLLVKDKVSTKEIPELLKDGKLLLDSSTLLETQITEGCILTCKGQTKFDSMFRKMVTSGDIFRETTSFVFNPKKGICRPMFKSELNCTRKDYIKVYECGSKYYAKMFKSKFGSIGEIKGNFFEWEEIEDGHQEFSKITGEQENDDFLIHILLGKYIYMIPSETQQYCMKYNIFTKSLVTIPGLSYNRSRSHSELLQDRYLVVFATDKDDL